MLRHPGLGSGRGGCCWLGGGWGGGGRGSAVGLAAVSLMLRHPGLGSGRGGSGRDRGGRDKMVQICETPSVCINRSHTIFLTKNTFRQNILFS